MVRMTFGFLWFCASNYVIINVLLRLQDINGVHHSNEMKHAITVAIHGMLRLSVLGEFDRSLFREVLEASRGDVSRVVKRNNIQSVERNP